MSDQPPLIPLHQDHLLISSKLAVFERLSSDELIRSLLPGHAHSLKTRPDGTMLDGHHRIYTLRMRRINVDALPREVISPDDQA